MSETMGKRPRAGLGPTEVIVAEMWSALLGRTGFGSDDDFFAAGANSLLAIKLLQRVERRFGRDALTPEQLYADARLTAMAAAIDGTGAERCCS